MTIAEALAQASRTKAILGTRNNSSTAETKRLAINTIDALIDIIGWYDRNQKRLIKGISNLTNDKFSVKTKLFYNVVRDCDYLLPFLDNEEKLAFVDYVNKEFGGDPDDAA